MAIFWIDSSGAGRVGAERAMKRERELREIMEQAIEEMREVLSRETEEDGKEGLPLGSGAVEGGHRHVIQDQVEVAWGLVEGGDAKPHAGLENPAVQRPMGSLLDLTPTAFSHTRY